jgi:serine protease Do
MAVVDEIHSAIGEIAARQGTAVVGIERRGGRGSGFVVGAGEVLTLASNLRTREPSLALADGRSAEGRVIGSDPDLDLALIAADTGGVDALEFGEIGGVGAAVVALANPGGQGLRATLGFVAATDRAFRGPRGRLVSGSFEHTAPLPRGSGGGPLLDLDGRVVGLNAVRVHGGLILALPAVALTESLGRLRSGEEREQRRLGVAIVPPRVARRLRRAVGLPERDGLLVRAVAADSSAERAGIQQGDLIVAAGERVIDSVDALYAALDARGADSTLELALVRGTEELSVTISFGAAR